MKIFHHNDADGRSSAAIILNVYDEAMTIEVNYQKSFPVDIIEKDEKIFIVDYSVPPPVFEEIRKKTTSIVWIDHHKTAIDRYRDVNLSNIVSVLSTKHSGCFLTWKYIFPEKDVPKAILLIEDWDIWKKEYPESEFFVLALDAMDGDPRSYTWKVIWEEFSIDRYVEMGKNIRSYVEKRNESIVKEFGFDAKLWYKSDDEDYAYIDVFAVNMGRCSSKAFDSVHDDSKYDGYVSYIHDGRDFSVSVYSTTRDISDICKSWGGGGHPGAGGFNTDTLPLEVVVKKKSRIIMDNTEYAPGCSQRELDALKRKVDEHRKHRKSVNVPKWKSHNLISINEVKPDGSPECYGSFDIMFPDPMIRVTINGNRCDGCKFVNQCRELRETIEARLSP